MSKSMRLVFFTLPGLIVRFNWRFPIGTHMSALAACKEKYNGVARKGVEAIEMKLKGYEATEIAKHYDTSVNNVNAWISRARSKLRNEPALLEILY